MAILISAALLLATASAPARAMDLCAALDAAEGTRTQVSGLATAVGSDSEYPYLFVEDAAGKCEILVEAADKAMLAGCAKGADVTAIGVLRFDEEAAFLEDVFVNYLDEASVICE